MNNKKKVAAVVITAVAITGSASTLANASGSKSKTVSYKSLTTKTVANTQGLAMRGHSALLATVLADLVKKGTINDAQSKAITDAFNAAETAEDANRPQMGDGPMGGFGPGNKDAIITATLGIDSTTLHQRLAAGESLATIAGAKKDALIAALVADETKRIDAAVAAGKLTASQATTLKSNLTAHVTEEVNSTAPMGRGGMMGGRGHGHGGGMGMPKGSTNGIPSTTTSSSN